MCGMNKLTQTVDWLAYYSSSVKNDFKEGSLSQYKEFFVLLNKVLPLFNLELLSVLLNHIYFS